MSNPKSPWWQGRRGEWYVVAQGILFAIVVLGPRDWPSLEQWPDSVVAIASYAGAVLMALGTALAAAGGLHLGSNLTPLPHPKDDAELVVGGAYRLVRHPIYGGLILLAFGWALFVQGTLTLLYALLLLVFFDLKSRREEHWLLQHFPHYAEYRQRVRKLIPFIY